jgi:hypothetical protein
MWRWGAVMLGLLIGGPAQADITLATYDDPTTRYAHGVLGDAIEFGSLVISHEKQGVRTVSRIILPDNRVFEDIAPRLLDVTGDGRPEVVVVETHVNRGAQLAVYDETGKVAATPYIGTRNRWLAPIGAVDMDGDGRIEIGYIDRPHLAKTLRLWRYVEGELFEIATQPGLTNHRIGEDTIAGGVRTCDGAPEMLTANANWTAMMATRMENDTLVSREIGTDTSRPAFARALVCQ